MRNPNETSTTIKQTTSNLVIEFGYNSANVAKYDLEGVKNSYANASSVVLNGKTIVVTIPLQ